MMFNWCFPTHIEHSVHHMFIYRYMYKYIQGRRFEEKKKPLDSGTSMTPNNFFISQHLAGMLTDLPTRLGLSKVGIRWICWGIGKITLFLVLTWQHLPNTSKFQMAFAPRSVYILMHSFLFSFWVGLEGEWHYSLHLT